ncbi:type-i specificity determinant subunit [Lacticaseibacillus thailandensis DSM 22698 = JCM 13996]|uniref:Type-i specificity determinant subunit n=2 Tax=Lacticaseibacillus thailandensis TaxID=381741 RepID=A0A0R2C8X7_9LACO|nr:type-i specificity determinant subunit [Lacticaseibacillus thailandensis DSM 22698 = JCM 13996]
MKVPQLRFKGFTGDWEQRKLGELATFTKGSGFSKEDLIDEGRPVILYGSMYTDYHTIINKVSTYVATNSKGTVSAGNEVIVPASGETAEDIARASAVITRGVLLAGDLNIITPCNNLSPIFLALIISNGRQKSELVRRAQGISIVHLGNSALKDVVVKFPSLEEQIAISSCISLLDQTIALHQRKHDLLLKLKKGYLQKLFPGKGQKVPEIRFKGFTEDWEQRKFGTLYAKASEKNDLSIPRSKVISVAKMHWGSVKDDSTDEYMRSYNVFRLGDIAFEGNRSKNFAFGRFVENTLGTGLVSHVFDVFRPKTSLNLYFWQYYIHNENSMRDILRHSTQKSTMMTNLVTKDLLRRSIGVPSQDEQQEIGQFMLQLDQAIALHQRRLDELKKLKQGYLQKLFI